MTILGEDIKEIWQALCGILFISGFFGIVFSIIYAVGTNCKTWQEQSYQAQMAGIEQCKKLEGVPMISDYQLKDCIFKK
jgi:hypothetical protein